VNFVKVCRKENQSESKIRKSLLVGCIEYTIERSNNILRSLAHMNVLLGIIYIPEDERYSSQHSI